MITNKKNPKQKKKITIKITHPEKILYPEDKITKQELVDYYESVQEKILPFIIQRPLTFVRCPNNYKECFFQKHMTNAMPPGLFSKMIQEKNGKDAYIYLKNAEGLLALPQLGVLEIHTWNSQISDVEHPDMLIFDLDPAPSVPWKKVVTAAKEIRELFAQIKLTAFVKTTGGKGLHVVIPIEPHYAWEEIKQFTKTVVDYLVGKQPKNYIEVMTKTKRTGKIFIDYLRNGRGATSIAPYSTRARKGAPVATPLFWDELSNDIRDTSFTMKTVVQRLATLKKDPWQDFFSLRQALHLDRIK